MSLSFTSHSEADTERVGAALGRCAERGSIVLLLGDLGAGKTAFVRGVAEGLGADPSQVSSPTFALVQTYSGRLPLVHADLYRVQPAEVEELGLLEVASGGVLVVEWAERLAERPPDAVVVRIVDLGDNDRSLRIEGAPEQLAAISQALGVGARSSGESP